MEIISYKLKEGLQKYQAAPKMLYCEKGKDDGLFVLKPTCLKSPFVFETLELSVEVWGSVLFTYCFSSYPVNCINKP